MPSGRSGDVPRGRLDPAGDCFALQLPEYDGYFTWSLLVALTMDGRVEALQPGKRNKKYRLA